MMFGWHQERRVFRMRLGQRAVLSLALLWIPNFANTEDPVSPAWAYYYNIDLTTFDLDADADGDGLTGREEAGFGTDPLDAASVLRPRMRRSGDELQLEWDTVPDVLYQIEASSDLITWDPLEDARPGTGAEQSAVVNIPGSRRFFHVKGLPPPDSDGDGLNALEERFMGTDPDNPDSDGDTFLDGEEAFAGASPGDPTKTPVGDIPPEPASIAPPVDPSATTNAFLASQFLYTGDNPIQTGVAESAIEGKRAAIMRGKVTDRDGRPLPGVRITILNGPEFGQTLSRADGMFDLVVNGGGRVTVRYERNGFLPVQRSLPTGWLNFAHVPDVALTRLDTAVTSVSLAAAAGPQIALGSEVSDDEGSRRGVLLVNEGTQAEIILPDGSTRAVENLNVRITEYTVGDSGPNAMPGMLPPTSAYTYAFELSADESVAKVAGKDVLLSQPVYYYVDNFLDFPVGIGAPVGYYDNDQAVWVPSESGRVIGVVGVAGGLAELDLDGDGSADSGAALTELGIDDAERAKLAGLYQAEESFWRVALDHFSTWDVNWGVAPSVDRTPPELPPGESNGRGGGSCGKNVASFVLIQDQLLGESVPLVGTPFELVYTSDRTRGWRPQYQLNIPLTREELPDGLVRVDLDISIAGHDLGRSFAPAPNLSHTFEWNRYDVYGNFLNGAQPVTVRIGYVYESDYSIVGRFGFFPDSSISVLGVPSRGELSLQQNYTVTIGGWDESGNGLGGWTFDVHHSFDAQAGILHLGDGGVQLGSSIADSVINTVAGGGWVFPPDFGTKGTDAILNRPVGVAAEPSGGFYVIDQGQHRILYFDAENVLTRSIGNGTQGFSGDGGPASLAQLSTPRAVSVGPAGSLFIAEHGRIRRVDPDGFITSVAGTGVYESSGDGGPATEAGIGPTDIAAGSDGSLYIADLAGHKVRRVGPDGLISTVAGDGFIGFSGDGGPAADAELKIPISIDVADDGSIYVAEHARIRKISPDGIIQTVAGNGTQGSTGDGYDALGAMIDPVCIAVAPDGGVYFSEACRIRRVRADGIITAVAGSDACGLGGDGGPAAAGKLHNAASIDVGPDASVYVADQSNHRVRRIEGAYPGFAPGDNPVLASEDGKVVYRFSDAGRHLETIDALTGGVLFTFSYDSVGRLVGVADGDGNLTEVERDTDGNPTAIVAPYGQRTELELDDQGLLSKITNPADESRQFAYTDGGLMTLNKDADGHTSEYDYDEVGRLAYAKDACCGSISLARIELENGYEVTSTTALGRVTTYRSQFFDDGISRRLTILPDGRQIESLRNPDGEVVTNYPDGTVVTLRNGPDPRFGMQAPVVDFLEVSQPDAGLVHTFSETRQATFSGGLDNLNLASHLSIQTYNGNSFRTYYDGTSNQLTTTTPQGRSFVSNLDELGRQESVQHPGLSVVSVDFDSKGRPETIESGSGDHARTTRLDYNAAGYLDKVTDSLMQEHAMAYDAAGRLSSIERPDHKSLGLKFNADGNLVELVPPDQPAHRFSFTDVGLRDGYLPPDVGAGDEGSYLEYNAERQLTRVERPDGKEIKIAYSKDTGMPETIQSPRGSTTYSFYESDGYIAGISTPAGIGVQFDWENTQLAQVTWSGQVEGKVGYTYDNNLNLRSVSVNGANQIQRGYDKDGLLTAVGSLAVTRHPLSGFVSATSLDEVETSRTYNQFGELERLKAEADTEVLLDIQYTQRDKLGRILQKVETIEGAASTYDYEYDPIGRLVAVSVDGTETASYEYDDNGNRLVKSTPAGSLSGSVDAQDRLITYGTITFSYTASGELASSVEGSYTTSYDYDVFGNLRSVVLPDATEIEYLVDGRNRRVGKKLDGSLVQQFLYLDQLNPVAELDGSGNLVSRFVYGTRSHVPDFMVKAGTTYRIVSDHLGSVRLVVDVDTGTVTQRIDYDEYGQVTLDSNPGFQPFGFAGGIYDTDTGLIRFGARDYDPEIGRWTAEDPIGFRGGQSNLWIYVNGDPLNSKDPLGLSIDGDERSYFYGGLSFGGGIWNPYGDDNRPNYFGAAAGIAVSESAWDGRPVGGIGGFVQGTAGRVLGGYIGGGFKAGMMRGESLSGETNSAGLLTPFGSFESVWDACTGTWLGIEIGLGPSFGAGLIGSWSDTAAAFLGPG